MAEEEKNKIKATAFLKTILKLWQFYFRFHVKFKLTRLSHFNFILDQNASMECAFPGSINKRQQICYHSKIYLRT